jgi:hypothetical protein
VTAEQNFAEADALYGEWRGFKLRVILQQSQSNE